MENKADVKAIMARFQASGSSTDETSSTHVGRMKQTLQPTLSSGVTIQTKKPVLESLSGSAINLPPKPTFHKNTVPTKGDTMSHDVNKNKPLANRFANTQDETNDKSFLSNKQFMPTKPPPLQPPEAKSPLQKPPLNKPSLSFTLSDSKAKPAFPKPSPAAAPNPSSVKEDSGGDVPPAICSKPKMPPLQQKPSSNIIKLWQQNEEQAGANADSANKAPPLISSTMKPSTNFRTAQNILKKEQDKNDQSDSGGTNKSPLSATPSVQRPKPPASKKPSLRKPSRDSPQPSTINSDTTSGPKRNPLPNSLALGAPPAKPNRPPRVNLESFTRGAEASNDGPSIFKKSMTPPPPTSSHPSNRSNHATPPPPHQPALPSLPPRHPGSMIQQEDFYDDVDELSSAPPPPPPTDHPSQKAKVEISDDDDDGEMYEDLEERWEVAQQKAEKKKEKEMKEAKKRLEAEKKEMKEREKKEQDARKKFKLVGPLEAIHQGKACVDCKGNKTDLSLKQGECLDIIRVQGNPEGKWLGRTQDGAIGYVKNTSVEIDFNVLKNHQAQQAYDPEVYDDIDTVSSDNSGNRGPGVVLPPLPEGGEIYDDVADPNLEIRVPPPSQFTTQGISGDDDIYDDVDSENGPPPVPISSFPILRGKNKPEEIDSKKQKKIEKEEKDFRKKFKYEGEIKVLNQVTIVHTLTNKRWTGKELPVKAGEKLDVIVKAVDNKLICRNEEGKFGYVSTCYIDTDDPDIYDDIGDDCIYDND